MSNTETNAKRRGRPTKYDVYIPLAKGNGYRKETLSIKEVAAKLGCSYMTAYMRLYNKSERFILAPVRSYTKRVPA